METKYCKKCDTEKPFTEFRIRIDKRRNPPFEYLNNQCKECDAEYSRNYHNERKDDNEYKKVAVERVKEYNQRTGYSKKRWRKNKYNEQWKENLKKWREENKKKVVILQKQRSLKYHIKNRDKVSDAYVISRLKDQFQGITKEEILNDIELIHLKRAEILNHRLKKIVRNGKK